MNAAEVDLAQEWFDRVEIMGRLRSIEEGGRTRLEHRLQAALDVCRAERDQARLDAERLADALARIHAHAVFEDAMDCRGLARDALAGYRREPRP